jgi:hypothetical protein
MRKPKLKTISGEEQCQRYFGMPVCLPLKALAMAKEFPQRSLAVDVRCTLEIVLYFAPNGLTARRHEAPKGMGKRGGIRS